MNTHKLFGGHSIALVGAASPVGQRMRAALERAHVDGKRVHLFSAEQASPEAEATLTEYAEEPRLIQNPDLEAIQCHNYILICESGQVSRQLVMNPPKGKWLVDLCHDRSSDQNILFAGQLPEDTEPSVVAMPHPIAFAIINALQSLNGITKQMDWSGWCIRPASDFGESGVEELKEQTVRLLNFATSPKEVFGRQLAFNMLPERMAPADALSTRARIMGELAHAIQARDADLQLTVGSIFFGHVISLHLRFDNAEIAQKAKSLLNLPGEPPEGSTPVELAAAEGASAKWYVPTGEKSGWLWLVHGDLYGSVATQTLQDLDRLPRPEKV